jgi:hypothetical protein
LVFRGPPGLGVSDGLCRPLACDMSSLVFRRPPGLGVSDGLRRPLSYDMSNLIFKELAIPAVGVL